MEIELNDDTVRAFVEALHAVENDRDPGQLADLTDEGAEVLSIDGYGVRRGPDGMRELFTQYLAQLDEVRTTFTRATEQDGRAALEWSSEVVLHGGGEASYTGVTVVEVGDGKVTGFSTVYDSGALLHPHADGTPTAG